MAAHCQRRKSVRSSLSLAPLPNRPTSLRGGRDRNILPNRRDLLRTMRSKRSADLGGKHFVLATVLSLVFCKMSVFAQVSPNEILNPDLRVLEQTYFQQLIGINQSIGKTK